MVLGFSVAVAVATGVLAGLAPLWQAIRTAPNAVLSEGVRASAAAPARRLSKAFVVAEIALAFTLLRRRRFSSLTCAISNACHWASTPTWSRSTSPCERRRHIGGTCQATACRAGANDGRAAADARRDGRRVREPAASWSLCGGTPIYVEGRPHDALGQRVCPPGHTGLLFDDADPLRAGRLLNESDSQREALTVVINEAAARGPGPARSDRRLSTPQPPDNDRSSRRRRRRRAQQRPEQAASARDLSRPPRWA